MDFGDRLEALAKDVQARTTEFLDSVKQKYEDSDRENCQLFEVK